jgi:Zn-dependent protease
VSFSVATVFLIDPPPTNFDLHFSLFGIPVRVHPLFFLLPVLWGAQYGEIFVILIFILVFFVSILVHELGHALAMQSMGQRCRIVLYAMGGFAAPDGYGSWGRRARHTTRDSVLISAAGPIAGFLLALLGLGLVRLIGGTIEWSWAFGVVPVVGLDFGATPFAMNFYLLLLFSIAININIYWNLINLLPVLPLDGGQIARDLLLAANPWQGMHWTLWTSIIVATGVALVGFSNRQAFLGILFAYLAIINFQTLQQGGPGGFGGGRRPW